jgi:hypothetical protein
MSCPPAVFGCFATSSIILHCQLLYLPHACKVGLLHLLQGSPPKDLASQAAFFAADHPHQSLCGSSFGCPGNSHTLACWQCWGTRRHLVLSSKPSMHLLDVLQPCCIAPRVTSVIHSGRLGRFHSLHAEKTCRGRLWSKHHVEQAAGEHKPQCCLQRSMRRHGCGSVPKGGVPRAMCKPKLACNSPPPPLSTPLTLNTTPTPPLRNEPLRCNKLCLIIYFDCDQLMMNNIKIQVTYRRSHLLILNNNNYFFKTSMHSTRSFSSKLFITSAAHIH